MESSLVLGYLAAALMFSTFFMRLMIPLRIVAMISNAVYIFYAVMIGLAPMILLHSLLLPLNAVRLVQMYRLIREIKKAASGDLNVNWLLPYMSRASFPKGQVLADKGAPADIVYYILEGRVKLDENGVSIGAGNLLGEMGVFTPEGLRLNTMRCETEVTAMTITVEQIRELYFQNPQLGFYLTQLVVGRLVENQCHLEGAVRSKAG
jgi:hypothetical protein